jgi:phosphopentomutase/2,3-bisphosphoglycerate-independent phosphoglycerate mutase family metalloenzyme
MLLILAMLLPLGLSALFIYGSRARSSAEGNTAPGTESSAVTGNRLVLVIIDSLRHQDVDELMPNLKAFAQRQGSTVFDVHTAGGNMTLPCIQTILEGRESPYASAIHDFTGQRSSNNSLPAAAARADLHPALIADFIILGLYGQYATITVNRPDLAPSELGCDLAAIDKTIDILSNKSIRLVILHVGGTDAVSHRWHPGHPEYARHFRGVDAKLSELIEKLDLKNDHLIVTGDHGHNDRGLHVPLSVAIFAGGIYPQLFAALGAIGPLQQVDTLFFMAFAYNLPLPINYEGHYFGIETPVDAARATPEIQQRLDAFRKIQADALHVSPDDLASAIAEKRAQARLLTVASFQRALPLLVLFLAWITVAFRINDFPKSPIWPLLAMSILAIPVWLCATPTIGITLAVLIGACLLFWAIKAGEFRRLCFLLLLLAGLAWSAFDQERSQRIFRHYPVVALLGIGTVLVLVRELSWHGWPAAFCGVALFVLPSTGFKIQLGPFILSAWFLGAAAILLGVIVTRRFRQIRLTGRAWIALGVLLIAARLLRGQRPDIGRMHNVVIDSLSRPSATSAAASIILYLGCAAYLVWIVRRPAARLMLAATMLILPLYSCGFGELPFAILAVVSVVPVFFASWSTIFDIPGPLKDESALAQERFGLFLATTLIMTFWMLFQGFFIQEVDFSFALKFLPEKVSGLTEMAFSFPLTFVKYALPLVLVVFTFVGLRGLLTARRAMIAALIFCNFKLATLLAQIFIGPLGTQQKFYELAMSDFVFVSQLELIAALTFLGLVLCASGRSQALAREAYVSS